ncbi:MAG: hypothetical protein A2X74_03970 [Polynucleobacter sp. GWA2_45_21]|nr:MAG: hypothetical protein A2X74_03970 [Polynucleobacter sp. GWA2_45_21]HBK43135.1 hypothetical protein [Polynucleobacter sp.]
MSKRAYLATFANFLKNIPHSCHLSYFFMRCMLMEVANMSTRLKRWARAIQQIDLSKRTPEVAVGYLDSKYRDIAWRYIRILGFERTISFMASNNFHPE